MLRCRAAYTPAGAGPPAGRPAPRRLPGRQLDSLKEGEDVPPFTITLKDVGFNINDYLTSETATISMKDVYKRQDVFHVRCFGQ